MMNISKAITCIHRFCEIAIYKLWGEIEDLDVQSFPRFSRPQTFSPLTLKNIYIRISIKKEIYLKKRFSPTPIFFFIKRISIFIEKDATNLQRVVNKNIMWSQSQSSFENSMFYSVYIISLNIRVLLFYSTQSIFVVILDREHNIIPPHKLE